jgi:oligopeptide transport system substrate-binding protein
MIKKIATILIFIVISFACTKKDDNSRFNKVLNLALTSEVSTLDPVNSYDNVSGMVMYNLYEQLYEYHYLNRPYELKPLLAESLPTIENQGKRYIIKLKKNIQYHDHPAFKGKPRFVVAEDFITAIKRLSYSPLNSSGWFILDDLVVGVNDFKKSVGNDFEKFKSTPIKGVFAINSYTLVIELKIPSPQFIYKLSMSFISPTPLEVVEYEKNDLSMHPVGTGAFYLNSINSDNEIFLKRFLKYHEASYPTEGDRYANGRGLLKDAGEAVPFVDEVRFKIVKENKKRWDMFLNHELDIIPMTQEFYTSVFDDVGNLKEDIKAKSIRLQAMPTLTYWWLAFNMQDSLVGKNLNLRLAIAHAINMNAYISKFTNNTGQIANSILPPGVTGYNTNARLPYEYNLEKAKKYLKMAGFPDGKNLPEILYDTRSESKISMEQAQFFADELSKVGIKLKIIKNKFNTFLEKSKTNHLQFFQDGWTLDFPDAENVFLLLITSNYPPGPNTSYFSNSEYNKLYSRLTQIQDGDEKKQLISTLEKIVDEEVPWIMQYYSRTFMLYHDNVKNFRSSDLIWNYPKYIRLK